MKVFLAENDLDNQHRTSFMLKQQIPEIELVDYARSVKELILKLDRNINYHVILSDIQFSDGLIFDALEDRHCRKPIIFMNPTDQFALRSFDYNCVDYILKPVQVERLVQAFNKFKNLREGQSDLLHLMDQCLKNSTSKPYKKRFMTKVGNKVKIVSTDDISYLFSEEGLIFLVEKGSNQKYIIEYGLLELETELLDPSKFYRINRSVIINSEDLLEMKPYLNSRLILILKTKHQQELVVARERVSDFKKWINQ
jgi:two-component system, LytTR family, response regulator LytT